MSVRGTSLPRQSFAFASVIGRNAAAALAGQRAVHERSGYWAADFAVTQGTASTLEWDSFLVVG